MAGGCARDVLAWIQHAQRQRLVRARENLHSIHLPDMRHFHMATEGVMSDDAPLLGLALQTQPGGLGRGLLGTPAADHAGRVVLVHATGTQPGLFIGIEATSEHVRRAHRAQSLHIDSDASARRNQRRDREAVTVAH